MQNSKYPLREPNMITKQRILEIRFYLFIETFLNQLGKHSSYKAEMLGILCNAFNLDTSALLATMNALENPHYKPSAKELVIVNHLSRTPVRHLTSQKLVSNGSYYNYLQDYIDEGEPTLQPKLQEIHHKNLETFFNNVTVMFINVSNIFKGAGNL